jgi:hydroxymethylpyrimidine/phosphomethylpyrimidine kinase
MQRQQGTHTVPKVPVALTVAGLDPSGGAGIAADLRAFARRRVYGCCVATAITLQTTKGVSGVIPLPGRVVEGQLWGVLDDLEPEAVKVGMVANRTVVGVLAKVFSRLQPPLPLVLDPVLAASAGGSLAAEGTVEAVVERLMPLATVVTPNLGEARRLAVAVAGERARRWPAEEIASRLHDLGPTVVVTGIRKGEEVVDLFCGPEGLRQLQVDAASLGDGHGSGCTYSAALAAGLAKGEGVLAAARAAQRLTARAIANRLAVGRGQGPVDPFGLAKP